MTGTDFRIALFYFVQNCCKYCYNDLKFISVIEGGYMSKAAKNKSYFNGKLPKFTQKELDRIADAKPSALLLKAMKYVRDNEKSQRAA